MHRSRTNSFSERHNAFKNRLRGYRILGIWAEGAVWSLIDLEAREILDNCGIGTVMPSLDMAQHIQHHFKLEPVRF